MLANLVAQFGKALEPDSFPKFIVNDHRQTLAHFLYIDRKKRLALGSNWSRLAELTSNLPFAALLGGRTSLRWRDIGLLRIAAGLLLYAVLYLAHPILTGMPVVIP